MKSNIGFVMTLIGCAGMAEAYGSTKQIVISAVLIGAGIYLVREGLNAKSTDKSNNYFDANRPFFLP